MESNSIIEPLWPMSIGQVHGKKLLFVDDDLFMREITGMFLNEKGYACTTVKNAVGAIDRLKSDQYDLVIANPHLPEMDGMALLKWIKHHLPDTKVIMVTGETDMKLKCQAILQGADHYLIKPFTLEKIFQEIEGCLMNHHAAPEGYTTTPLNAAFL